MAYSIRELDPINQGGADIEVDTLFEGVTDTPDSRGIYARKVTEKQLEEFIARRRLGVAKGSVETLIDERILETTGIPEDIDPAINENDLVVDSLNKEYARAKAAEDDLDTAITDETTRATDAEGDLSTLTTVNKNSLVEAINEIEGEIEDTTGLAARVSAVEAGLLSVESAENTLQTNVFGSQSTSIVNKIGNMADVSSLATNLTGAVKVVDEKIDGAGGLDGRVADLETTVDNTTTGLVAKVGALETTVGSASSGLVKDVTDLQDNQGDLTSLVPTATDLVSAVNAAYAKLPDISGLAVNSDYKLHIDGSGAASWVVA